MSKGELTTKEVALRFNVSPITARLWCRRGLFPKAYELDTPRGKVWMIPEKDIESFEPPKKTGRPPKAKKNSASKAGKKTVGKKR
jgi:hypothetical protein